MDKTKKQTIDEFIKRIDQIKKEHRAGQIDHQEFYKKFDLAATELNIEFEEVPGSYISAWIGKRKKEIKEIKAAVVPEIVYTPTEIVEYEENVLRHNSFFRFLQEEDYEPEERKDIVAYKREKDGFIEEYRFDKEVIFDEAGKYLQPNPKGMKRDLNATFLLAKEKGENPVSFYEKEKFLILGMPRDEIKKMGGAVYQRSRQDRTQLAELRYKRWKILPNGKKKLVSIINSPYTRLEVPETKEDPWVVWINADYLESINLKTGELKPGKFKQLPSHYKNPYQGKFVEEKAFEWLIRSVRGRNLIINAETILLEKLNMPKQRYQRLEYCFKQISRWLQVAKNEGYRFLINPRGSGSPALIKLFEDYDLDRVKSILESDLKDKKIQDPTLLGDVRKWQVEFFSPIRKKFDISDDGIILTEKILKFLYDENDFGLRNPREKSKAYIYYYLERLNEDLVEGIFNEIKDSEVLFTPIGGKLINQATMLFNELALALRKGKKTPVETTVAESKSSVHG